MLYKNVTCTACTECTDWTYKEINNVLFIGKPSYI